MTAGLQPGDLVIVAGRPSMGKTTLALNIAENAAISHNVPVAVFSHGNVARAARVPHDLLARPRRPEPPAHRHVRRRGLGADQQRHRADEDSAPIFIDDSGALTPTEVRARARGA